MSFPTSHAAVRFCRALSAPALGLVMAACGGGGADADTAAVASGSSSAQAASAAAAPAAHPAATLAVTVEGCVLDRFYVPTTGTPVRALAADGRLLGNALSDGQGRFTLRLPAHSAVLLQVDRPQGESHAMRTDAGSSTWGKCLLDDQA